MLSTETQGFLRRIRMAVLEGRWIKGHSSDGLGNYCLSGYIDVGIKLPDLSNTERQRVRMEAYTALHNVVQKRGYSSIPVFNDSYSTQKDDVVAVIDEALRTQ